VDHALLDLRLVHPEGRRGGVLAELHAPVRLLLHLDRLLPEPLLRQREVTSALGFKAAALTPPINAAAFEMLTEALRHWNLVSLGIKRTAWFPEVLDHTIEALPRLAEENQVVHERTVCAMLRFVRNLLIWADPSTSRDDGSQQNAEALREMQQNAQALVSERPLPRGVALPRLVAERDGQAPSCRSGRPGASGHGSGGLTAGPCEV